MNQQPGDDELTRAFKKMLKKPKRLVMIDDKEYKFIRCHETDGFGKMISAKEVQSGIEYSIKMIKNSGYNTKHLKAEYQRLQTLNHENIVHVDGVAEESDYLFVLLEFASEKCLLPKINEKNGYPEICASIIIYQIIEGVQYLHSKNIAHRDLKPEKFFFSPCGTIKIVELGFAKPLDQSRDDEIMARPYPSYRYRAPEISTDPKYDDFVADIYSIGVILEDMVTNFGKNNVITPLCQDIIYQLKAPAADRITLADAKKHPFLQPIDEYHKRNQ